jgi:hypothetical protein
MDMVDIYTDYLIFQKKYATATGLSDLVDGEFSHGKVTRFLRLGNFNSKALWKHATIMSCLNACWSFGQIRTLCRS